MLITRLRVRKRRWLPCVYLHIWRRPSLVHPTQSIVIQRFNLLKCLARAMGKFCY